MAILILIEVVEQPVAGAAVEVLSEVLDSLAAQEEVPVEEVELAQVVEPVLEEELVGAEVSALGAAQAAEAELDFQAAGCAPAAIVLGHCCSRGS